MGEKFAALITNGLFLFMVLVLVAATISAKQERIAANKVDDFINSITYKGYFTRNEYDTFLKSIPIKNIKVELVQYKSDNFMDSKPDVINAVFTKSILSGFENDMYKLNVGDILKIDVIQLGQNPFDSIMSSLAGSGVNRFKLVASRQVTILNTKYN